MNTLSHVNSILTMTDQKYFELLATTRKYFHRARSGFAELGWQYQKMKEFWKCLQKIFRSLNKKRDKFLLDDPPKTDFT